MQPLDERFLITYIFQAIEYNGDRSFEAIVKFVESDGKIESTPGASVIIIFNYFTMITSKYVLILMLDHIKDGYLIN